MVIRKSRPAACGAALLFFGGSFPGRNSSDLLDIDLNRIVYGKAFQRRLIPATMEVWIRKILKI